MKLGILELRDRLVLKQQYKQQRKLTSFDGLDVGDWDEDTEG